MKSKLFSLVPMAFLMSVCCLQTACETTLAARNPGHTAGISDGGQCERQQNNRTACDDTVGCVWDYEKGNCSAH